MHVTHARAALDAKNSRLDEVAADVARADVDDPQNLSMIRWHGDFSAKCAERSPPEGIKLRAVMFSGRSAASCQLMPAPMVDSNRLSTSWSPERSIGATGGRCHSQQSRSAAPPPIDAAVCPPGSLSAAWMSGSL